MAAVPRRLPTPCPIHALVPALGSGGMNGSAELFVLFPAKISYAGGQGADSRVQRFYTLACHPERSRRTFITPIRDPSLRSGVVRAEACLLQAGNLFRRIFPIP